MLLAFYLHLGPFSRKVIAAIDRQLDGLHNQRPPTPMPIRTVQLTA
jgi:hypothetical protein